MEEAQARPALLTRAREKEPCKGEADSSFEDLLQQLSAAHALQQEAARLLAEENAELRERLREQLAPAPEGLPPPRPQQEDRLGEQPGLAQEGRMSPQPAEEKRDLPPDESETVDLPPNENKSVNLPPDEKETGCFSDCSEDPKDRCSGSSMAVQRLSTEWMVPDLWPEWTTGKDSMSHVLVSDDLCGPEGGSQKRESCFLPSTGKCLQRFVVRPTGAIRLTWDYVSGLMVCYDVIAVPLMAVSLEQDSILGGGLGAHTSSMDLIAPIFWTLDIPFSFLTGFHIDGVIEMRVWEISKNYFTTWFAFDLLLMSIDWVIAVEAFTGGSAHTFLALEGTSINMTHILRVMRLLRAVKLPRISLRCIDAMSSESMRSAFHATMTVLCIFTLNHYLACGWFLAGRVGSQLGTPNWIEENRLLERTVTYAYFTSLHWSLTQFTPASMEIRPYNVAERVYNIACLLFACVTISSFLGSITASISDLRKHSSKARRQQFMLRAYLSKNNVPTGLCKRIWSYLQKHHYNQRTGGSKAEQLDVLRLLPTDIYDELHRELYAPYLTRAPFFYQYRIFSKQGLMELCSRGITEMTLICQDVLFAEGKVAEKMYFTVSGYMTYDHRRPHCRHVLGKGSWAAEPVLWVQWVHAANMIADSSCEILALNSAKFRALMQHFRESLGFVRAYAQAFHKHLQEVDISRQTDIMIDKKEFESLTEGAASQVVFCNAQGSTTTPLFRSSNRSRFSGFWDSSTYTPRELIASRSNSSTGSIWRRASM